MILFENQIKRTVHKPFVKQETDKHVLPFNENPLFENPSMESTLEVNILHKISQ